MPIALSCTVWGTPKLATLALRDGCRLPAAEPGAAGTDAHLYVELQKAP
jgi:hypothetical protein